jgi:hypothetical protein
LSPSITGLDSGETVLGIDAQGRLRVRDAAGRERAVASAEFGARPLSRA